MNFPMWESISVEDAIVIATAIIHTFASHLAIGGGLYLALAELWARHNNDNSYLAQIQNQSRFFAAATIMFAAISGICIWITAGLVHPSGFMWIIDAFAWSWVGILLFLAIQIRFAFLYLHSWKKTPVSKHRIIGLVYLAVSLFTLMYINAASETVLVIGNWSNMGNAWDYFFDIGNLPAVLFRACLCLTLAGLYATVTIAKEKDIELKARIMRRNGLFILIPLVLAVPTGLWYFGSHAGLMNLSSMHLMIVSAGLLFVLGFVNTIVFPRHSGYISAGILMLMALLAITGFELSRMIGGF